MEKQRSIVIIGGGLSGLALGAYIKDTGFNSIILEKTNQIGGVLQTQTKNGYLLELGANTTSSNNALEELVNIIGIEDKLTSIEANPDRYIVKKNKLHKVSPKPKDILFSPLLSAGAKWKLYREGSKRKEYIEDETVGDFFERRFGKEVVDYFVNPMIAGIYAGDPYQLSLKSVFPQLMEWEQKHGSISKALKQEKLPKRKIVSFQEGMSQLVQGLETYIGKENVLTATEATGIVPLENDQYLVEIKQDSQHLEIVADVVVLATPSYVTAEFLRPISADLANLMDLHYPKMGVIHLGYNQSAFKKRFEGFGFLIPEIEQRKFLGAIANSSFLPNRVPEGKELFTLYIGGTRQEHLLQGDPHVLVRDAVADFQQLMQIEEEPELQEFFIWENSIPQFGHKHQAMLEGFNFFENNVPNLHILGNYRSGLSVADCITGAKRAHGKLIKDYSLNSYKEVKKLEETSE